MFTIVSFLLPFTFSLLHILEAFLLKFEVIQAEFVIILLITVVLEVKWIFSPLLEVTMKPLVKVLK